VIQADADGPAWPFFYEAYLEALGQEAVGGATLCVMGGRGTGRTAVVDEFVRRRGGEASERVFVLRGRDTLDFRHRLSSFANDPESGKHLVIDDLDHVLTEIDLLENSPVSGSEGDRSIRQSLEIAIQNTRASMRTCIVTSTISPTELLPPTESLSLLLQKFRRRPLPAWKLPWKTLLPTLAREATDEHPLPRAISMGREEYGFGDAELQRWLELTLELSGGHPLLMGPGLRALHSLLERSETQQERVLTPLTELLMRQYLQHQMGDEIGMVRKRIRALEASRTPPDEDAVRLLRHLAAVPSDTGAGYAKIVIDRLERLGLIGSSDDVFWHIPGTLVRAEVNPAAPPAPEPVPDVEVRPRPGAEQTHGTLLLRTAGGERVVKLSGRPWQLVRVLERAHPSAVSNDDLRAAVGLKTIAGLRSAIQRLDAKLKQKGMQELLENTRGEGYRLAGRSSSAF
jgi:hypothetical protein